MTDAFNLSIQNMAASVTHLCSGGVYLIYHESTVPLRDFAATTLASSAALSRQSKQSKHYWIADHQDDALWTSQSSNLPLLSAVQQNKIKIFKQTLKNTEFSAKRLIRDFKHFGISRDSFILLEGAEGLFPNNQETQLIAAEVLCEWALEKNCTLILFAQKPFPSGETSGLDPSVTHLFSGVAYWRAQAGVYEFEVPHWFGREASTFGQKFPMNHNMVHGLPVFSVENLRDQPSLAPREGDESLVLITRTALMGHALPSGWRLVEDNDAFLETATGLVAATLVLHFDRNTDRSHITEIVYQLRRLCGLKIRIAVREINTHLRYTHEHILLLAGANMVIPATLAFSQLRNLLNCLYGQTFNREVNISLTDLLVLTEPELESPLLTPEVFAESVRKNLKQTRDLSLGNSLIYLTAPTGDNITQLMNELSFTRQGDIFTSTLGTSLFIYLPGCSESDIDYALDRAFRYRWTDLIISESRYTAPETIEQALRVLLSPEKFASGSITPSSHSGLISNHENTKHSADVTILAHHRQGSKVQHRPLSRLNKSSISG
ncbi:MAG: hypothetical protein G3H99_06905 [Ferrovum sp.]|nr:hypothetical protein [Ferrovum sp.]NDU87590.1 hypothetical protein [Ferrovum sp.]